MAQGIYTGLTTDPIGFGKELGKSLLDWDTWADDPARAIGHLVPDAIAAVATAGTGALATRGAKGGMDLLDGLSRPQSKLDNLADLNKLDNLDDLSDLNRLDNLADLNRYDDVTPAPQGVAAPSTTRRSSRGSTRSRSSTRSWTATASAASGTTRPTTATT